MQEPAARRAANAIIETAGHRKGLPFSNELFSWLKMAGGIIPPRPYHFLTDKYVHFTLKDTPDGVRLTTTSAKQEALDVVNDINEYLSHSR